MPATISLNVFDLTDTDWQRLGDTDAWKEYITYIPSPAEDPDPTPLSLRVFDKFNVPVDTSSAALLTKGTLPGYDIKNMDAFGVVRLSLLEEITGSPAKLIEVYCNPEGDAQFLDIGATTFAGTARYRIYNRNITNIVEQVAVTGFDPPAMVYVRGPFDVLQQDPDDCIQDPSLYKPYEYVDDIAQVATDTCYEKVFERYATIMYRAPVLRSDWKDTLDSLYEVQAFEEIIGWIHQITFKEELPERAEVIFSDTTPYPVSITYGQLNSNTVSYYSEESVATEEEVRCYIPPDIDFNAMGINISALIPNSMYFNEETGQCETDIIDIRQIFIIGYEAYDMVLTTENYGAPQNNIFCKTREQEPYNLNQNNDYVWGFDDAGNLKLVFGRFLAEGWMEMLPTWDPWSVDWIYNGPYDERGGSGSNWGYWGNLGGSVTGPNFIFNNIWIVVTRKKNSVTVFDPDGHADTILTEENFTYNLYALVKCDPPAPTAGKGVFDGVVDHTDCIFDHNPMTFQDLTTCDEALLEEALTGPSFSITLPFVDDIIIDINNTETTIIYPPKDESKLYAIASYLYEELNEHIDEITYVLGPDEVPQLGDSYQDGIINEINYSYSDASSYLISVKVGPKFLKENSGGQASSIWEMQTESVTKEGVITQSAGNGIHYVVHVEGMGDFVAVNTMVGKVPPEVGDRVTIQIDNIPVGWR